MLIVANSSKHARMVEIVIRQLQSVPINLKPMSIGLKNQDSTKELKQDIKMFDK